MSKLAYLENESALRERRSSPRKRLRLSAENEIASGAPTEALIHHIFENGLLIESSSPVVSDEQIDFIVPHFGAAAARVAWNSGRYFVCQFVDPLPTATVVLVQGELSAMKNDSAEALSQAAFQLTTLSMAIQRLNRVLDRAIDQLPKRDRG